MLGQQEEAPYEPKDITRVDGQYRLLDPRPVEPGATMIYKAKAPQPTEAASAAELGLEPESFSLKMNGRSYAIEGAKAVLGRSKDCDVQVEDANVSRRHAELRREGSTWWLVDLDLDERHRAERQARPADGSLTTATATITPRRHRPSSKRSRSREYRRYARRC
jgi:hypothetical protein